MSDEIREVVQRRGISRLCHFTPSRNLVHIAAGGRGILSTSRLTDKERSVYTPTDLERIDGFTDHVCCSIEYPNGWYFETARRREHDPLFPDWVVLLIHRMYLWADGTRFAAGNAARGRGSGARPGIEAFRRLFAPVVSGVNRDYVRTPERPDCVPTDDQAEVLVRDSIAQDDIIGVAVKSEEQAANEYARLSQLDAPVGQLKFLVAPTFYRKRGLSRMLKRGERPREKLWSAPTDE